MAVAVLNGKALDLSFTFSIARSDIVIDLVFSAFEISFTELLMNMIPMVADSTSEITAAQSIVTIL